MFFNRQITIPHKGPSTNVPISSGKSEKSNFKNDGTSGIENSIYCNTTAMAVSMAVTVSLVVRMLLFVDVRLFIATTPYTDNRNRLFERS